MRLRRGNIRNHQNSARVLGIEVEKTRKNHLEQEKQKRSVRIRQNSRNLTIKVIIKQDSLQNLAKLDED